MVSKLSNVPLKQMHGREIVANSFANLWGKLPDREYTSVDPIWVNQNKSVKPPLETNDTHIPMKYIQSNTE